MEIHLAHMHVEQTAPLITLNLLNGDNTEKFGMREAQIGLSGRPNRGFRRLSSLNAERKKKKKKKAALLSVMAAVEPLLFTEGKTNTCMD